VELVSLYNFPLATESVVPVTRLGFDVRERLTVGFDMIDTMRRGGTVEKPYWLKAYFQSELEAKYGKGD
jgi:hypothetical protein